MIIRPKFATFFSLPLILFFFSCQTEHEQTNQIDYEIVIFSINDAHGRLENFSKIKPIIEAEKNKGSTVFFVSAGDLFSGNPIVDYYESKGFPIIDLLNKTNLDVSVLGNHEFDYGQEILVERIDQAQFPFICLNMQGINTQNNNVLPYYLMERNGLRIVFVGLVETNSPGGFPLTHPKKIQGLEFTDGIDSFDTYKNLKSELGADLLVALTHQGQYDDENLMNRYPSIDLTIGGHTNQIYGFEAGGGYMVMSGKYLETLGKTTININSNQITDFSFDAIDLTQDLEIDLEIAQLIEEYNDSPDFYINLGYSSHDHNFAETSCFYTDGLKNMTNSDLVIQNSGGIRNLLDMGVITPFEIYSIDPFGNGLETFEMSAAEMKTFLAQIGSSYSYSANFQINDNGTSIEFILPTGEALPNNYQLSISMNDYISYLYYDYLPDPSMVYPLTTAEYIIQYVQNQGESIENQGCNRILNN